MQITRIFEFDAGHRIPNHHSKCKNMHGHRYRLELTLSGEILTLPDQSFEGMVLDFGDVKELANEFLDELDHAFLVYEKDVSLLEFLKSQKTKYMVMLEIPTVENIAQFIGKNLAPKFAKTYNDSLKIKKIKLWETPNCFAELNY